MRGSLRPRGQDSYTIAIYLGVDEAGKKKYHYETFHGKKRDAEAHIATLVAKLAGGTPIAQEKKRMHAMIEEWLVIIRPNTQVTTYEGYKSICEFHLKPNLGHYYVRDVTPKMVAEFYNRLLTEPAKWGRRKRPAVRSGTTALHIHRVLHQIMQQALASGYVARNVIELVKAPRQETEEKVPLNPEEVYKLLQAAFGKPIFAPVVLAVTTGMRRSEVLAMRWRDVWEASKAQVRKARKKTKTYGVIEGDLKTVKSRRKIPILPLGLVALEREHQRQDRLRETVGGRFGPDNYVCVYDDGTPLKPDYVTQTFSRLAASIGLSHVTFHGLRHTYGSLLYESGVDLKAIQELLGHSRISTTADIYTHSTSRSHEEAVNKLDRLLPAPSPETLPN